ncbi:T9SS type A sorting domain-containing protein [Candidatus Poribacteria bacterium]|nr:T9SS type A sorting domain-containing protein [Candidatus Poribacteria bacterium]
MRLIFILLTFLWLASGYCLAATQELAVSQGEDVTLTVKLVNIGDMALTKVHVQLDPLTTPPWIQARTGAHRSVNLPAKNNADARPSALLPFSFTVGEDAPENTQASIRLWIRDEKGDAWTQIVSLKVLPRPRPEASGLFQNYPNPFNPETWIPYQLAQPADVKIQIYDAAGRLVRTLDLGDRAAGFYMARADAAYWDGRNETGERVSSGVYFYHLQSDRFSAVRRMVIIK